MYVKIKATIPEIDKDGNISGSTLAVLLTELAKQVKGQIVPPNMEIQIDDKWDAEAYLVVTKRG